MGHLFGSKPDPERLTLHHRFRSSLQSYHKSAHHRYVAVWTAVAALLLGFGATRATEPAQNTDLFLPLVGHSLAAPPGYAAWSSPLAISAVDGSLWVVNPDAGSVSVIDGEELTKRGELSIGGESWLLALSHDGASLFVIDRAQGRLVVVDRATLTVTNSLIVGNEPGGLVLSAGRGIGQPHWMKRKMSRQPLT